MASEPEQHVQNPNAENEEKPRRKMEKTVLDNFKNILNPNEKIRMGSNLNLLRHLMENDNVENQNEIKYALGRIVRGLGSSSVNARTGFYTALTGLLNVSEDIAVDDVFENINKELHKAGSNSKGENADVFVGQILACGAVMRSNLWNTTSEENRKKLVELMIKASKERSYLGLLAYTFIINKFQQLNQKDFKNLLPLIQGEFFKPWDEQDLDSLYLLVSVKNNYPHVIQDKILGQSLGTNGITCAESLEQLCNVLMAIPRLSALNHPVYDAISKEIANSDFLPDFLTQLDRHLVRPNRNKHLIMIKILSTIMENLEDKNNIAKLLSKNFVQQTINYFKSFRGKDRDVEFKKSIHKFSEKLVETSAAGSSFVKISILRKLLFFPGTFIFEKITKSKVVQQITSNLNAEGVQEFAAVYRGVVQGTEVIDSEYDPNSTWLNNDRLYAAHLWIKLLNHPAVKTEVDWKVEQLGFLMDLALLKPSNDVNIGCELAAALKTAFFGALDLKHTKLEDQQKILFALVSKVDLKPDNLEASFRNAVTEEQYEIWEKAMDVIRKLKKTKSQGLKSVFLTLFLHLTLQLFNDSKLASDSLKELFICYAKTKKNKRNSKALDETNMEETVNEENKNDPLWIEVVTDLFLNLLSHSSHLLRSLINSVFPYLCKYMTSSAIHQILSVLDPKNEDNPLSRNSEETDDESDDDDESNEIEEENENDEESESELEEDDEDETPNDKLRMALHQVLISNGYQTDEESIDLDQLSDTEGEKLNDALAETFKQFKPNLGRNKKQSKEQESLTHFRVRVLDLIEIYLDSTPSMLLTLEIMLPLLQAVEFSIRDEHQKPFNDRLKSCLKKLSSIKTFSSWEGVDDTVLCELLQNLLEKGTKTFMIIQDMGVQIADCCIYVIRCSEWLRNLEDTPKKIRKHLKKRIAEIISGELQNYFHKRDCLIPYVLFKNTIQLPWDGTLTLVALLLEFVFKDEVKPFKKTQAVELLKLFYTNQRYLKIKSEKIKETLLNDHSTFFENVNTLFKSLCENLSQTKVKERFICNLLQLLSAMKNCCLNIDNINWSEVGENVREYRSYVTFSKDAKMAFNKFCKHVGVSQVVKMKEKTITNNKSSSEDEAADIKKEKKKKKKTLNKEKLKLKKEAKELRLKSLSEGFGRLDFTSVKDVTIRESDDEENSMNNLEESNKKRKKNKEIDTAVSDIEKENGDEESNSLSGKKRKKKKQSKAAEDVTSNTIVNTMHNSEQCSTSSKKKRKKNKETEANNTVLLNGNYKDTANSLEATTTGLSNKKRKRNKESDVKKRKKNSE